MSSYHTKTLPDGRVIDINKLQELVKDSPIDFVTLSSIRGCDDTKRTGFSKSRYEKCNPNIAGILSLDNFILDGRHRYFKRLRSGCKYMPVRYATMLQIEICIISQGKYLN
jgi:hypothetical protein